MQIQWACPSKESADAMDEPSAVPSMFELEQRVLYDASPLAAVMQPSGIEVIEPVDISDLVMEQTVSDGALSGFGREVADLPLSDDVDAIDSYVDPEFGFDATTEAARQLVVVDSAVENYQLLISSLDQSAQVLVLDANRSGIEQISQALSAS